MMQSFSKRQFSVSWMSRHKKDQYVKQAVAQDMRSRSAFKLLEIQDAYKFISSSDLVLDLGAAPGGLLFDACLKYFNVSFFLRELFIELTEFALVVDISDVLQMVDRCIRA